MIKYRETIVNLVKNRINKSTSLIITTQNISTTIQSIIMDRVDVFKSFQSILYPNVHSYYVNYRCENHYFILSPVLTYDSNISDDVRNGIGIQFPYPEFRDMPENKFMKYIVDSFNAHPLVNLNSFYLRGGKKRRELTRVPVVRFYDVQPQFLLFYFVNILCPGDEESPKNTITFHPDSIFNGMYYSLR